MEFVVPSKKYLESYYEGCSEMWNNIHNNYIIHNPQEYEIWKNTIFEEFKNNEHGINLPEGFVPSVTYWIVSNGEYIGTINIRLKLSEQLKKYGGHIGVAIRPSRQSGMYGFKASLWAFNKAHELGISPVLATCFKSNRSSLRFMTSKYSNYYKIEEDTLEEGGKTHEIVRFWYK